jgi:hypothetical protein
VISSKTMNKIIFALGALSAIGAGVDVFMKSGQEVTWFGLLLAATTAAGGYFIKRHGDLTADQAEKLASERAADAVKRVSLPPLE